jgi:DHA1 family bicyclomycin/chloramphenicol resistance-like MFS transporter
MASGLATHGQQAGTAAALMSALQFLFATLVGSLVGLLHNNTGIPLALMMALCGTSAWLSHHFLVKAHH